MSAIFAVTDHTLTTGLLRQKKPQSRQRGVMRSIDGEHQLAKQTDWIELVRIIVVVPGLDGDLFAERTFMAP
jgi:hypothetical protein